MGRLLSQLDPKPPDCKSSRLGFGVLGGKPPGCLDKRPLWTFPSEKVIKGEGKKKKVNQKWVLIAPQDKELKTVPHGGKSEQGVEGLHVSQDPDQWSVTVGTFYWIFSTFELH